MSGPFRILHQGSGTDAVTHRPPRLRRDLASVAVDSRPRAYRIVIDEISGRFARVSEYVWQSLNRGEGDESLWHEAQAAGWTQQRPRSGQRAFSPLYFRIPIASVDALAMRLAPVSGIFFSAAAFLFWSLVIVIAVVLAASRSVELFASLGSLRLFLDQSKPVWLAVSFLLTKVAHELAHAVMCRRMGSRCGSVGLLFLAGIPCPYCDVTDIWRQPSAARRAAVMLAGIYIELIIAALATLVWVSTTDPVLRLHALNLMLVCGVSTIVFNANPLMRYDGYYVLADLVGSTNLRQESRDAFRAVVTSRIAGKAYRWPRRSDLRSTYLARFHAASTLYRLGITVAIATLLLSVAEYLHLRGIAVGIVIIAMMAAATRLLRRIVGIARASGYWSDVSARRRWTVVLGMTACAAATFFLPLPRYRSARGHVDAANALTVYLPGNAVVETVSLEIGEAVRAGQSLLRLRNDALSIQQAKLGGQLKVASLRNSLSRQVTLDRHDVDRQWKTFQAAEDAVRAQLASVRRRAEDLQVAAPISGLVLPPRPSIKRSPAGYMSNSLHDRVGASASAHQAWCRIGPDGRLDAVLVIDARDRTQIDVGAEVKINLLESPEKVFSSTVTSVSAIEPDAATPFRHAAFRVLCPLPDVDEHEMLRWIGKECKGVFHLPSRPLASDITRWLSEWLGGKE